MKNKKKWIIVASIVLLLIILAIGTFFVLKNTILLPKTKIIENRNLTFEINSEVKLLSIIASIENGTITSEDQLIDTTTLGEKEITIKYLNERNKEQDYIVKILITDTQPPVIEAENEITLEVGTEIILLDKAKVTDNSKEEITPTIEGEYAFNVEGDYKLKYVAIDSSNNRAEKEFTFKVIPKPVEETKPTTPTTSNNKTTNNKTTTNPSNNGSSNNSSNSSNNSSNNNQTPPKEDTEEQKRLDALPVYSVMTSRPKDKNSTWRESTFFWYWQVSPGGTPIGWKIGFDSKVRNALENAKKYLPTKPTYEGKEHGERGGEVTLYVKLPY